MLLKEHARETYMTIKLNLYINIYMYIDIIHKLSFSFSIMLKSIYDGSPRSEALATDTL